MVPGWCGVVVGLFEHYWYWYLVSVPGTPFCAITIRRTDGRTDGGDATTRRPLQQTTNEGREYTAERSEREEDACLHQKSQTQRGKLLQVTFWKEHAAVWTGQEYLEPVRETMGSPASP